MVPKTKHLTILSTLMPHLRLKYPRILSNLPKLAWSTISLTSYVASSIVTKPLEPPLSVEGFTFGPEWFMTSLHPLREFGEGDKGEAILWRLVGP